VVRIYRRSLAGPGARNGLVGIVEDIGRERRTAFHNLNGLIAAMTQESKTVRRQSRRKGRMP
jgi:hypothetical protein